MVAGIFYALVGMGLIASSRESGDELRTSIIMIIVFLIGTIVFTKFSRIKGKNIKHINRKEKKY